MESIIESDIRAMFARGLGHYVSIKPKPMPPVRAVTKPRVKPRVENRFTVPSFAHLRPAVSQHTEIAAIVEPPARRELAQSILAAAARARGEQFSSADWIESSEQDTRPPVNSNELLRVARNTGLAW